MISYWKKKAIACFCSGLRLETDNRLLAGKIMPYSKIALNCSSVLGFSSTTQFTSLL